MAEQTITLPSTGYSITATSIGWGYTGNNRPQIDNSLTDNLTRYLVRIQVSSSGAITFNLSTATLSDVANADLSDAFESSGSLVISTGSYSVEVTLAGADTTEPYNWTPGNSAEVVTFFTNVHALGIGQSGTLIIRDFTPAVGLNFLHWGDTTISKIYWGDTQINKAYWGSNEL